jgi:hypothetical protein
VHFPSSYIAHATLGYISLNIEKDSGATFEKKRGKSEKREGEKRTKCHTRREGPTSLIIIIKNI